MKTKREQVRDVCQVARCRREAEQVFLGRGVCAIHWDRFMSERYPDSSELRRRIGIKEGQ